VRSYLDAVPGKSGSPGRARGVHVAQGMRINASVPVLAAGLMLGCGGSSSPAIVAGPADAGGDAAPPGACGSSAGGRPGVAPTTSGTLAGELAGETYAFRGVPFAAPPVGDRRFKPPEPAACWEGERPAVAFGSACPQWEKGAVAGDEDCLTLNVWTPKGYTDADKRPVLVFVHGGGHQQGSSSQKLSDGQPLYDGRRFVEKSGAVMVTINYRLGPLGFLAHPALSAADPNRSSGNYGTLDQIEALKWVKANIARFGGDPARVLVFGESAGAVSVCRLVVSPLARGLFAAAVMESGACVATPLARAEQNGAAAIKAIGCDTAADPVVCARQVPAAKMIELAVPEKIDISAVGRMSYDGVVDGWAVPAAPIELIGQGKHNKVPIIVGANTAETGSAVPAVASEDQYKQMVSAMLLPLGGQALVDAALAQYPASEYPTPRAAYVALTSDVKFVCTARKAARAFAKAQAEPVYRYVFSHVAENASATVRALGAVHGSELPFVFGNVYIATQAGPYTPSPGDLAVVDAFNGYWSRMAAAGDPNGGGALAWPRYDATSDQSLRIAGTPAVEAGHRAKQCDFWDSVAP
jgi:para-nitrobenzyl esterase